MINYLADDSEPRRNPVFTEYLALLGKHTYKYTSESGNTEVLYKPFEKIDSDVGIKQGEKIDDKFAINLPPIDFSDTEQIFLVDWFYPT
jgi:hypothetical protein